MSAKMKKHEDKKKAPPIPPITIENAKLIWRNFSGIAKQFNAEGLRNFHVILPEDFARQLESDGWNVRWHDPREEGEPRWPSLKVAVRFDMYPPVIIQLTPSGGKARLNEQSVEVLDWAEITVCDLTLSPSRWENAKGERGIKAYLKKMYVTLYEDELDRKYRDSAPTKSGNSTEEND